MFLECLTVFQALQKHYLLINVTGLVEPYRDEPLAHSSDADEEDNEVDEDGLSPAILRARFEGESPLTEW